MNAFRIFGEVIVVKWAIKAGKGRVTRLAKCLCSDLEHMGSRFRLGCASSLSEFYTIKM